MIYLFNDVKELTGTVRNNHILNLLYEREKNGIYSVSAEIPVTYNDQGTVYNYNKKIQKSDFLGHYDKEGRFQLHKIAAVDIENGSIFVKGIHIFFDEAKAGAIIKDRRFVNREIIDGARVAFESIGWSVADFDVSVGKTYNFYNVTPLEARQILVETFGFEFDYWLDFDGKKVTNRHVAVKEKIGEKTNKRYTYGHNVLNIRAEQDYSEIYTAVIGRGKGEEIEETGGYGRRIEYTDVVWSTPSKPLNKPVGTRVLEDINATQLFGYKEDGVVKPRIKVEVFSDIESPTELIQASYEWLMDNNVPKAVFSLKVADGDGLNLGDEVYVIYRDIDLVKSARVEKVIDDLVSGNRDVEFGDTAYFDTDRRLSGLRSDLKRYSGETGDRIYQLKMEFNRRFDEEVSTWVTEFEQNLIDQKALIEADRENMTNLIEGTRTEWTDNLNAEITQTKEYAEQQAIEKANEVQSNLESATGTHQSMIESLETNVLNIDEFIGPKDKTLTNLLEEQRSDLEQKIQVYNRQYPNMQVNSAFENINGWRAWNNSQGEIELRTEESINYIRVYPNGSYMPSLEGLESFNLKAGSKYVVAFDFRSSVVAELDNSYFLSSNGNISISTTITRGLQAEGNWHRYYWVIDWTGQRSDDFRLMLGTHFLYGGTHQGDYDIRQIHIYEGTVTGIPWSPSPSDNSQVIQQLLYEVNRLDDGMSSLATKTEFDILTEEYTQFTNEYIETSEYVGRTIQEHDDWLVANGSHVIQAADLVGSQVWLDDIYNPNLLSFTDVTNPLHREHWTLSNANAIGTSYSDWVHVRSTNSGTSLDYESPPVSVVAGEAYTISWLAWSDAAIDMLFNRMYLRHASGTIPRPTRKQVGTIAGNPIYEYKTTFTATTSNKKAAILFSTDTGGTGRDVGFRFRHPKLELGKRSTPYYTSFSTVEQRADEVFLAIQGVGTDGFLTQNDIVINNDYVQLGSQILGDNQLASILRVSPNSIDAVAEAMRLSGDLYVDGDITALAISAIEGNFARLFASQLAADVITSDHIQVGTQLVDKLFATSARIDELITKTHFVNEMHALTLNVVELNASEIRARLLTVNAIEAEWLKGGTALIDRVFASTAMFERMMAKNAFVTTLSAITLDLHELTIWRPDGVAVIQNGMQRFGLPVTFVQQVSGGGAGDVLIHPNYWETNSRGSQTVGAIFSEHAGRWLNVGVGVGLRSDSDWASSRMAVVIRPTNTPSGVSWSTHVEEFMVYRDRTDYHVINVPLGRPSFGAASWTLEFYRIGDNNRNPVQLRRRRMWISA